MKDKLTNIFNLTQVSLDEQCDALACGRDIYKIRLKKIANLVFNVDDKYEKALLEIANIVENSDMPYCEIFARDKVKKANDIARCALGKPTDYSKQMKLEF